jgi:hypothetical protein
MTSQVHSRSGSFYFILFACSLRFSFFLSMDSMLEFVGEVPFFGMDFKWECHSIELAHVSSPHARTLFLV